MLLLFVLQRGQNKILSTHIFKTDSPEPTECYRGNKISDNIQFWGWLEALVIFLPISNQSADEMLKLYLMVNTYVL